MQKPVELKIYDDKLQKEYPNKRLGKHASKYQMNEAINEYLETGDKKLGVELIRKLHWNSFHNNNVLSMVSEQVLRYKRYEVMESENDFQKIFKVAQAAMSTKILNRLFFATYPIKESGNKRKLSYKQISDIVKALGD